MENLGTVVKQRRKCIWSVRTAYIPRFVRSEMGCRCLGKNVAELNAPTGSLHEMRIVFHLPSSGGNKKKSMQNVVHILR